MATALHLRPAPVAAAAVLATAAALLAGKPLFDSYYVKVVEAEQQRKQGSAPDPTLVAQREAEKAAFAKAKVPLERAMEVVARGRRGSIPGLGDGGVAPAPSDEQSPIVGWAGLAKK